jgi:hypothetical protein
MKKYLALIFGLWVLAVPAFAQFAIPSRPYGFDQTHPAAGTGGTRFSIISGPTTGSINLIKPSGRPTNTVAPTASSDGVLGPSLVSNGTTTEIRFATSAILDVNTTAMAIFNLSSISATIDGMFIGGRQGGYALGYKHATGNIAMFNNNTGDAVVALPVSANIPYFLAASTQGTITNFVLLNLATGQMQSTSVTGTFTALINGTLFGYANATGGAPISGKIACASYTNIFLTLPQLQQIALKPWNFWYPER